MGKPKVRLSSWQKYIYVKKFLIFEGQGYFQKQCDSKTQLTVSDYSEIMRIQSALYWFQACQIVD